MRAHSELRRQVFASTRAMDHGWTKESFPDLRSWGSQLCGRHNVPRICDPDNVLSTKAAWATGEKLAQLARGPGPYKCPQEGYQVFMAVLRNLNDGYVAEFISPQAALDAFALDLASRSSLFGSCANGVVVAYDATSGLVGAAGAPAAPPASKIDSLLDFASMDDQVKDTVDQIKASVWAGFSHDRFPQEPQAAANWNVPLNMIVPFQILASSRPTLFFSEFMCAVGIAVVMLSLGAAACDLIMNWRHRSRFNTCLKKIEHVHRVMVQASGEMPLCPVCIDSMPRCAGDHQKGHGRQTIAFLCGHRFHVDCVDAWFTRHPKSQGQCPICHLTYSLTASQAEHPEEEAIELDACRSMNSVDEMKDFFLRILQEQYPDIISDENFQRWRSCQTEIWLSELECPWYNSLFSSAGEASRRNDERCSGSAN